MFATWNSKSALCLLITCLSITVVCSSREKPNIVIILADDLGIDDVSFRGSNARLTPNIDALAFNGVVLDKYYVPNLCTPSRATLLTGKYPIHTGTQHSALLNYEPWGLPLNHTTMPEIFRDAGYSTNLIGKWHLGFSSKAFTPLARGFDYHFGYYGGWTDYFDRSYILLGTNFSRGYDSRKNFNPTYEGFGDYSTDVFTNEAVNVIKEHKDSKPLFLLLSHLAVHAGNEDKPLQAPEEEIKKFSYISDPDKRTYAAMISKLDESVGKVIEALSAKKILNNTIVIFYGDNGAPVKGIFANGGSNFPLRGQKESPWEGGVHTAGVIYSPLLKQRQVSSKQTFYSADWLPTLATAAGINLNKSLKLDGLDLWDTLVHNHPPRERQIVHTIDGVTGYSSYMSGNFKYVNGTTFNGIYDEWLWTAKSNEVDPRSRNYAQAVLESQVGQILRNQELNFTKIGQLRASLEINCGDDIDRNSNLNIDKCLPLEAPCLFDLSVDPCERFNLAKINPEKLQSLENELKKFGATAVQPAKISYADPNSDPSLHNYQWTWWEEDDSNGKESLFVSFWIKFLLFFCFCSTFY